MKGNSFALGASNSQGADCSGPGAQELKQGWDIRPASIWDHLEPRLPMLCRGGGSCC